jgi:Dyp-type peroxidase family
MRSFSLDQADIQGDILIGLQKGSEAFIFFKIADITSFTQIIKYYVSRRVTTAKQVTERELVVGHANYAGLPITESFGGLNLGFTKNGVSRLIRTDRPQLEGSFEKGADHPDVIASLHDPPKSGWLPQFVSDRVDGVFLVTGKGSRSVASDSRDLLRLLGASIRVVYSEIGNTRPGAHRGYEHFGFLDDVSQPRVRGLTPPPDPIRGPDQRPPGQNLLWPGEFVFGYPGQHPEHPTREGPAPEMGAPWMRNGSFMVFRRLEQKVPEFRRFVAQQAARLGIDRELLAARMVGRWRSGAPLELAPRSDDPRLGGDERRNNDFGFDGDPDQRRCPYAAHIRKVYPRDDVALAEAQRHRIIRSGIPFGPEVAPGETVTRHSRGLMFVCYQTSIERQFEFIQKSYANCPAFVGGKRRPGAGTPVTPGYDPIIGQAPSGGARTMDEPYPNYPSGSRRSALEMPEQFVVLTAAAYFFMPSLTALRTALTR